MKNIKTQRNHIYTTLYGNSLEQASHGLWGSAGLKMPVRAHFFQRVILIRKVGHTDLVFVVRSWFVSRCVHVRLQVSVCSGLVNTQTDIPIHTDNILASIILYEEPSQLSYKVNWIKSVGHTAQILPDAFQRFNATNRLPK